MSRFSGARSLRRYCNFKAIPRALEADRSSPDPKIKDRCRRVHLSENSEAKPEDKPISTQIRTGFRAGTKRRGVQLPTEGRFSNHARTTSTQPCGIPCPPSNPMTDNETSLSHPLQVRWSKPTCSTKSTEIQPEWPATPSITSTAPRYPGQPGSGPDPAKGITVSV